MGLYVIAVDANPDAHGLRVADVGICDNIRDVQKMVKIGKKFKIDGVLAHGIDIPFVVSEVSRKLGLPGLDPKVAIRSTDKIKRIRCFEKNYVNCPKFAAVKTLTQARKESLKIGFPLIVKPSDNSGARGVKKINNMRDLEQGFDEALSYSQTKILLLEEFLKGSEISTESFVYDSQIITTGFADRNYSRNNEFAPYFVEDGHSVPSILPEKQKAKVIKEIESSIKALGINWGVAKGDILVAKDKVYVLEMAARTSGGWFATGTVPIATGINILKPLIKITLGEKPNENDFIAKYNKAACQRYIIPTESGIFERLEGATKARKMPGVRMVVFFNKPKKGEIIHKARNLVERFGHLIAEGETVKEATSRCEDAIKQIKIILK